MLHAFLGPSEDGPTKTQFLDDMVVLDDAFGSVASSVCNES